MVYVDTLTVDETYTCTVNTASKEQEFIPSVNRKHEVWKFHHHTSWPDLETGRDMANHLSSESFQIILAVHFPLMVWIIVLLQNVPTFFSLFPSFFWEMYWKLRGKYSCFLKLLHSSVHTSSTFCLCSGDFMCSTNLRGVLKCRSHTVQNGLEETFAICD